QHKSASKCLTALKIWFLTGSWAESRPIPSVAEPAFEVDSGLLSTHNPLRIAQCSREDPCEVCLSFSSPCRLRLPAFRRASRRNARSVTPRSVSRIRTATGNIRSAPVRPDPRPTKMAASRMKPKTSAIPTLRSDANGQTRTTGASRPRNRLRLRMSEAGDRLLRLCVATELHVRGVWRLGVSQLRRRLVSAAIRGLSVHYVVVNRPY